MDTLRISGIRAWGHTGFFDAEQELGQWFEVDLALQLDLSICGADDELTHSLNYAAVIERVKWLVESARDRTIERLNSRICDAVLAFAPVQEVRSSLTKVAAPIAGFDGRVCVEMVRRRGEAIFGMASGSEAVGCEAASGPGAPG
ncbi:MAG: dihydroneopterin aldolase [Cyanobium sp.]